MPVTISHALSATTPDDPAYEIQPQHWNSGHAVTLDVAATEISALFSNKNGVSFGLDGTNITASYQPGVNQIDAGGGGVAANVITFGDANNVSFLVSNFSIVGSIATTYAGVGFTSTTTGGTAIVGTNNTAGLSIGVPAMLTTARASNDAIGLNTAQTNVTWTVGSAGLSLNAGGYAGIGFTSTTTGGTAIVGTNNTAGLSIGVPAMLTTARASNDAIGLNTAATQVTWTVGSAGISLNAGGYLTTAMASNRGSDFVQATAAFAGTNANGTINSTGISVSVGAQTNQTLGLYMSSNTTSSASSGTVDARSMTFRGMGLASVGYSGGEVIVSVPAGAPSPVNFSAGAASGNLGSVVFSNSNGVSFGLNGSTITAQHNAITTGRASNDGLGLNTAQTNVTWTANSAGLSLNAAGYAGTGTSATNATLTLNSNGLAISVAAAAAVTLDLFANFDLGVGSAQQFAFSNLGARTNSVIVQPIMGNYDAFPGNITANTVYLKCSMSASTATMSSAHSVSVFLGVYTNNAGTLSLLNSVSTSWGSNAGNANLSTVFAGIRWLSIHSSAWSVQPVFSQAHYYWGLMLRTAGQSYNVSAAFAGNTIWGSASATASGTIGVATVASNATRGMGPWYGVYTAATAALPAAIGSAELNKNTDVAIFNPLLLMVRDGPTTF